MTDQQDTSQEEPAMEATTLPPPLVELTGAFPDATVENSATGQHVL